MRALVIDGETCETYKDELGRLNTENGQVYDLGGAVIDTNDMEVLKKISLINKDVFFGMPQAMQNAYFAEKIPQYIKNLREGKHQSVNTWEMWQTIKKICEDYKIDFIVGHNVWFDLKVLNSTMRYQTKSKKRYFFPYNTLIIDTMAMARKVIANTNDYIEFCKMNNYMTNHAKPKPRVTAEILWRYLTKNNNFEESHTGLKDVEIEVEIFKECLKRGYILPDLS